MFCSQKVVQPNSLALSVLGYHVEKVKRRKWQPCALCLHGRIKPLIKGQSSQQSCQSDNSYRKKWTITMRNWQGKSPELCHFSTTTVGGCALNLVCASRAWIHKTGGSLLSLGKGMLCYEEEQVPFLWKGSSGCISPAHWSLAMSVVVSQVISTGQSIW